ncbi:flavin reductase family protein [Streptomyces sp. NPDC059076]|uniref:flavin reductase family protein n=1 Tax=unclassified Streptomyces TaxID=2593676 RepID=UPI0036746331
MSTQVKGSPQAMESEEFRDAMSLLAAPLTIVTARDTEGRPWGFTASSVTSVSLEPPLLLVGMSRTSSCFPALSEADEFTVNVLGEGHRELARTFATTGVDRFAGVSIGDWGDSTVPYLTDVSVAFRCSASSRIPVGDHTLLVGELTQMRGHGATASPLVWYRRDFRMSV